MAEIKYGHVEGPGRGREYPVAASQYFHRRGGKFVQTTSGNANLCASGNTLVAGWAESPKDTAGADSWKSSATAAADKVFVVYGADDVYEIPYYNKTAAYSSLMGMGVGIVNVGSAYKNRTANATSMQCAKLGTTASPLKVVDVDEVNDTVFVKIKQSAHH